MNIMKFRPLFFSLSLFLFLASFYSLIRWQFQPSIDFAGGSEYQISLPQISDQVTVEKLFKDNNIELASITHSENGRYLLRFRNISPEEKLNLTDALKTADKDFQELRFITLGPSLGKELLRKTVFAIILSSLSLLIFIGTRFNDFSFGLSAVLAMFHDAFILIGSFSILGHFFGAQIDSLFVTALLTTLSASVHDTIVTFNRIRELKRQNIRLDWVSLANQAVTETLVRSINNSMTIVFMLFSLVILGGDTTRWFALTLLIGVVCGTYSSTGVAIPLVLFLKNRRRK